MLDTWYQPCQPEVVRMTTQAPARPGHDLAARPLAETRGWSAPGIRVLGAGVVLLIAGTVLLIRGINHGAGPAAVRPLPRHDPGARPALGQPVRAAAEGLGPDPQP